MVTLRTKPPRTLERFVPMVLVRVRRKWATSGGSVGEQRRGVITDVAELLAGAVGANGEWDLDKYIVGCLSELAQQPGDSSLRGPFLGCGQLDADAYLAGAQISGECPESPPPAVRPSPAKPRHVICTRDARSWPANVELAVSGPCQVRQGIMAAGDAAAGRCPV